MKPQKPLTNVSVCIVLLLVFTSLLLAYPLGAPKSSSELSATLQCPGGFPPPCSPPPPITRPTPRKHPQPARTSPQRTETPAKPSSTPKDSPAKPSSTPAISPSDTVRDQCSSEAKEDVYASFVRYRLTDQAKAYNDALNYLRCPAIQVSSDEQQIIDYLKKWSSAYEAGLRKNRFMQLLYNEKNYPEAYTLGREILTKDPDNLTVLVHLGVNGYRVLNNPSLTAQALDYARRALQQIVLGSSLDNWQPLGNREAARAYLNYTIGTAILKTDPNTALKHLLKSVEVETPLRKSPVTYLLIAGGYETGDYAKQSEDYKRLYGGKNETPESILALAKINKIIDRMIDSYARAVALAGNDAKFATAKTDWSESLTKWYKFRHNDSDAGLTEFIAGILSKPLPSSP